MKEKKASKKAPEEDVFPPDDRTLQDIPRYQLEVNQLDVSGLAPLHWAIRVQAVDKVRSLIEYDADVNLEDNDGLTPLRWAKIVDDPTILSLLVENGADISSEALSGLPDRAEFLAANMKEAEALVQKAAKQKSRYLPLSFKYFTTLPAGTVDLAAHLEDLNLTFNNLADLPAGIFQLTSLTKLDVSHNLLTSIPEEIGSMPSLKVVSFQKNYLQSVPNVFDLLGLRELDLSYNQLHELPVQIFQVNLMHRLNLSHNYLTEIPSDQMELPALQYLSLSHNYIMMIQEWPTANMPALEELDVSHNRLVVLPFQDIMNSQLKQFRFNNNRLPKDIGLIMQCYYGKTESLNLSSLGLTTIREELSLLTHLKSLSIRNNAFSAVPPAIGLLTNLTDLDLSFNRFTDLPLFLRKLTKLERLNLEETKNHITNPPKSVVDRGLKSIMGYFSDLLSGEPCYRMKLMFVGQENVGKSSLLHALMNLKNKKRVKRGNISTDGIDIERWTFKTNKQNITFSAWDFAGQEIYYTTHSFFLSQKAIYILVWDLRYAEDSARIEFWLNSVYSKATSAPVILVGTHLDDPMFENDIDKVNETLKMMNDKYARFSNIKGITAVSTVTADGVQGLTDLLGDIALKMPSMKLELPKIYLNLEDQVLASKETENPPAISWNSFMELASNANFKDEEQLLRATHFLNDLGSLVFFENDKTYERLIVLDPQWLTSMFASVITTSHKYIRDGTLPHKALKQIWKPPTYPEHLHPHLIALLEQFEILLDLPPDENDQEPQKRYLVPSLLPEEKPPIDLLWLQYDDQLQYCRNVTLEFIPNGLFSRFMVRFLHFADKPLKYWRQGVLAQRGGDKALVELVNNTIKIITRGSRSAEFLRIIIEIVDTLANSWFKVKITAAEVPCPACLAARKPEGEVHFFALEECEKAAARGSSRILPCKVDNEPVRLDALVPDFAMTDFEGSVIDYAELDIDKKLGKGSFGVIYRGTWRGEVVAVKRLKVDEDMAIAAFAEFRREVWLMSGLQHPCIVNLKGYSTNPLAMVMECVSGGDLYEFIHNEEIEFTWHLRLKIAIDMAHGMAFLHSINPPLLHRDLKSPNVLVSDWTKGSPVIAKVADFGLSSRLFVDRLHDRAVENPTWCAPEVMKKKPYTEKADVYSYGVMLWELLTRKLPFDNYTFQHQVEDDVIAGIRPPIPESCAYPVFADLIRACWHDDPNKRPEFTEVIEQLTTLVRTEIGEESFDYPLVPSSDVRTKRPDRSAPSASRAADGTKATASGSLAKVLFEDGGREVIRVLLAVTNQVWCGTDAGTIAVVSAESGRLLATYKANQASITALVTMNDKVVSGGSDGTVAIWKVEDLVTEDAYDIKLKSGILHKKGGKEKKRFRKNQPRWCELYQSGQLKYFRQQGASTEAGCISLKEARVDVHKGNSKFDIQVPGRLYSFQARTEEEMSGWVQDINKVITRFSETPTCQEALRKLAPNRPISAILQVDSRLVVATDASVRIVDQMLRGKEVVAIGDEGSGNIVALIDMGGCAWAALGSDIVTFTLQNFRKGETLSRKHEGMITCLVPQPGGRAWSGDDKGLLVEWNEAGQPLRSLTAEAPSPWRTLLALDEEVWCGSDTGLVIYNCETLEEKKRLEQHTTGTTCITQVFNLVWSAGKDRTVCIWN